MKSPLLKVALVFLLLLPQLGRAQESVISGRVVDAATKEPVPFASVRLREPGRLVISNEQGYFQIASIVSNKRDTLSVTAVGYNYGVWCIEQDRKEEKITIQLVRLKIKPIIKVGPCGNAVTVISPPKEEESVIIGLPGTEYAFFFKNEGVKAGIKIKTVTLYIGNNGFPREYFRLFIYKADGANQGPNTNLFRGQIAVYSELRDKTENWCTLDLRELDITMPEYGFYVSVEFPSAGGGPNQASFIDDYIAKDFIIGPSLEKNECIVWSQRLGEWTNTKEKKGQYIPGVWSFLPPKCGSFRRYGSMIKVEVDTMK